MAYNILHEMLSWMPAKAVIKFSSSLCKELCNIQSEYDFIKKQCTHSLGQDNGLFLQPKHECAYGIEFHVLPWLQPSSCFGIPRKSLDFLHHGRILTSSNGLVLFGSHSKFFSPHIPGVEFAICNPATLKWDPLSPPRGYNMLLGDDFRPLFECYPQQHGFPHSFKTDYTIALLVTDKAVVGEPQLTDTNKKQLLVYSNGKWEEELCDISIQRRVMRYDSPVAIFSDGGGLVVHYLCDSLAQDEDPPYIAAFDIRKKKHLRSIRLPKGAWHMGRDQGCKSCDRLWIFKSNNDTSICLVRWFQAKFTVWVVEKTGGNVVESWRRVMNKTKVEIFGSEDEQDDNDVKSFSVVAGKNLLLATSKRIYVFGMVGENKGKLEVVGEHGFGHWGGVTFVPYANTIRPVFVKERFTVNLCYGLC